MEKDKTMKINSDNRTEINLSSSNKTWDNTTLIAGDSMLHGIDETRSKKTVVKICCFPGAKIDNMDHYLQPLLKKRPKVIILHVGTNDT